MNPFRPGRHSTSTSTSSRFSVSEFAKAAREVASGTALLVYTGIALAAVWSIFLISPVVAVAVLALAGFLGLAFVRVAHGEGRGRTLTLTLAGTTLIASVAAFAAVTTFSFTPVTIPGWTVSALYGATLASGAWKQLRAIERIVAALFGVALIAVSTSLLVVPGTGEEAAAERPGFEVAVLTRDMHGKPVPGAVASCSLLDLWSLGRQADFAIDAHIADSDGHAGPWKFAFNHPFKAVLCSAAWRDESGDSTTRDESRVSTRAVYFPLPGGTYSLTLGVDPPFDPNAP